MTTPHPCWACGRIVAYRYAVQKKAGGGKARVPHKCPHGEDCVSGRKNIGEQGQNNPLCQKCKAAKRAA